MNTERSAWYTNPRSFLNPLRFFATLRKGCFAGCSLLFAPFSLLIIPDSRFPKKKNLKKARNFLLYML